MRFIHTADWHLGKLFYGQHLTDDQEKVLDDFLHLVAETKADAVLLSGDIYDRAIPPPEAVALFDEVTTKLVRERGVKLFAIAGNHDNGTRLGFGSALLETSGFYLRGDISPLHLERVLEPVYIDDAFGKVAITLLPYAEPALVAHALSHTGETIEGRLDHDGAMAYLTKRATKKIAQDTRSILLAHAFVTGSLMSDSEKPLPSVGGAGDVSAHHFAPWSYTALGHIHRPQRAGGEHIRYSGSLMKYSFDEAGQEKGVIVGDMDGQGQIKTDVIALRVPHDVRIIEGTIQELLYDREKFPPSDDYVHVIAHGEDAVTDLTGKLSSYFPRLMLLSRPDFSYETGGTLKEQGRDFLERSDIRIFADFYHEMTESPLSHEQEEVLETVLSELLTSERKA